MSDTNKPQLVERIDNVSLYIVPMNPPRTLLVACGTAASSVTDVWLEPNEVSPIGVKEFKLLYRPGASPVLTPVTAVRQIDLRGTLQIVVEGRDNSVSIQVGAGPEDAAAEPRESMLGFWQLVAFLEDGHRDEPLPGTRLTADIDIASIHGSGGCNVYNADYTFMPPGRIDIRQLAATKMHCEKPPGIMEQEKRFFDALLEAEEKIVGEQMLTLRGPRISLEFAAIDSEIR